jgi:hypothetical protein
LVSHKSEFEDPEEDKVDDGPKASEPLISKFKSLSLPKGTDDHDDGSEKMELGKVKMKPKADGEVGADVEAEAEVEKVSKEETKEVSECNANALRRRDGDG